MPYKQIFAHLYPTITLGNRPLNELFAVMPDNQLALQFTSPPALLDTGEGAISTLILSGDAPNLIATTPDNRYEVEIESFLRERITEFWLIHTDNAAGKFKRIKLNTEWHTTTGRAHPRITVSPRGSFFLADDGGIIRLYSAAHLMEMGAFQIAHKDTDNQIIALAVSDDEGLIAGLTSWKDIVVYSVSERRVIFVRQIQDNLGWYDPAIAHITLIGRAETIISVGVSYKTAGKDQTSFSVNAFRLAY